jgi:methenyltetrahydrofolate cyclohydrolase
MLIKSYILLFAFLLPIIIYGQDKLQIPGCPDSSHTNTWNLSLTDFVNGVADKKPVAGGGFVCAVTGTEALSLILMTLELSESRKKTAEEKFAVRNLIKSIREKTELLSCFAVKDKAAYQKVLAALKLPKSTSEEKLIRDSAIYRANLEATEIPLAAADEIAEVFLLIKKVTPFVSTSLSTDIGAAAFLLNATANGFLFFAKGNMQGFAFIDKEKFSQRVSALSKLICDSSQSIIDDVNKIIQ